MGGRNFGGDNTLWPYVKIGFLVLTIVKAAYIVLVFMHLGDERKSFKWVILAPYILFILYLIFICLTLSMTPLKRLTNLTMWVSFRRMLGLFVFFYASLHLLTYIGIDYRFNWQPILDDVFKKRYIFIGFAAWVLLIPLAITSSQKMIKLLKNNWKRLHRLIYIIAIFGSLHYIWLSKTIFFKPLVYLVIILVLLALRIKIKKRNVNYG